MTVPRTYRPGDTVKVPGIYKSAGGRLLALSVGEAFPASTKGTGWTLEERMAVERNPALVQPVRPTAAPIVIDPAAMEYAIDRAYAAAWNGALRELEAKLLSGNGQFAGKKRVLDLIEEMRIRRTMPASDEEGDPPDG